MDTLSEMSGKPAARNAAPPVFRFKAKLLEEAAAIVVRVPAAIGSKLKAMDTIEGTINGHPFRAPLVRVTTGPRRLRVNRAMVKGSRAGVGDMVQLAILGPEPRLVVPADLRLVLNASAEATAVWKDLAPLAKRDWVRWIEGAKTPETRARRVKRTVEQLSEGKHRPCCVNFYEYMLRYV